MSWRVVQLGSMSKPFKITGPATSGTNLEKLPDNRDTSRLADELVQQAKDEGKRVSDIVRENPVPDHEKEIKWLPVEKSNDAGRSPMKLK